MISLRKLVIFVVVLALLNLVNFVVCTVIYCPTCEFDDSGFFFQLFFSDEASDGYQVYPTFFNIIMTAILSFVYTIIFPERQQRKQMYK
ncbi:MAG: hypothetical protein RLZZ500_2648 [Bacteroidota bacterium]|jgi:hypothetical protein